MKRLVLLALSLVSTFTFAQTEDYSKSLLELKWGSGKLDAYMMYEPYHTFHMVGRTVRDHGVFYNEDSTVSVHIESIYFASPSNNAYIQLMYANDKLYAKNMNFYFEGFDVAGVQAKYKLLTGAVEGNVWMQHNTPTAHVHGNETSYETGKVTRYEPNHDSQNIFTINCGYQTVEDIYGERDGDQNIKGFYVYAELINTEHTKLDKTIHHPTPDIVNMNVFELDQLLD